jgi:hypothetical protein
LLSFRDDKSSMSSASTDGPHFLSETNCPLDYC